MSLSLDPESRVDRLGRLGIESGGLRAFSIGVVALLLTAPAQVTAVEPGIRIDACALAATFCALELSLVRGLVSTLVIGLVTEPFTGVPRGVWSFGAVCAFGALRLMVVRIVGAELRTVTLLAGAAAAVSAFGRIGLEASLGGEGVAIHPAGIVYEVLATALVGYPAYRIFAWASDRFRKRDPHRLG